jgi:AcrR family transcriptional regulator
VGVEAIVEAAETNKMTLYRHFRSKDALIAAYVTQLAEEGDAVWERLTSDNPIDPEAQIQAWLAHVEDVLTNRGDRGCALANAAVELQINHPARAIIEAYKARKRNRLVRVFREARYRNPDGLADEVFLLFEGAQISLQCAGHKGPASRLSAMLRSLLAKAKR